MKIEFNLCTIASLVNGETYPIQEEERERETKPLIITKSGLRFRKKDGWLQESKKNRLNLSKYNKAMKNQVAFGASAVLTEKSKEKFIEKK